ncbi:MAG: T9SS type A sorting domain-containing protein [Candidatus Sabulitectum sp.]|nr:T9SS type A sorting domain-containing protein [Candidatus Sabulitectum sp.]
MDWNNDGYDDILVGDRNGYINFFERNSNGTLQSGVKLVSNGTVIDVGTSSAPDFVDWDNDGDLDMIVGNDPTAPVRVYMNTGTASAYQFSGYTSFVAGGSTPSIRYSMPTIFDMNGDGLFDVVMGASDKKFHYYENTGTLGNPSFAADSPLEYQSGGQMYTESYCSRPEVAHWDEDGLPDIISGAAGSDDYVYYYMALPGVSTEESSYGIIAPSALFLSENPVSSNLSISINLGEASAASFTIYTMDGRVALLHTTGELNPGHNTVTIPSNLPNGTYMLYCAVGNRELTERFVVVR